MNQQKTANISLILAGIGLLLLCKNSNNEVPDISINEYPPRRKEFIGEYGYSEIEFWVKAPDTYNASYKNGISYDYKKNAVIAKNDAKTFLRIIDRIRQKFGFQELGEVYQEVRLVYDKSTKRKERMIYLVTNIKDDQLNGKELGNLFLNELFRMDPPTRQAYREKIFGIRILKNDVNS